MIWTFGPGHKTSSRILESLKFGQVWRRYSEKQRVTVIDFRRNEGMDKTFCWGWTEIFPYSADRSQCMVAGTTDLVDVCGNRHVSVKYDSKISDLWTGTETEEIGSILEYRERKCTISVLRMLQASMLEWKNSLTSLMHRSNLSRDNSLQVGCIVM